MGMTMWIHASSPKLKIKVAMCQFCNVSVLNDCIIKNYMSRNKTLKCTHKVKQQEKFTN